MIPVTTHRPTCTTAIDAVPDPTTGFYTFPECGQPAVQVARTGGNCADDVHYRCAAHAYPANYDDGIRYVRVAPVQP